MDLTAESVVAYVLGVSAAAFGLFVVPANVLGGGFVFVGGLVALPVVRRWLASSAGVEFSGGGAAGVFVACLIAGLLAFGLGAGGGGSIPGADVSNVSVSAVPSTPEAADQRLAVVWNGRAQSGVDPDPEDMEAHDAADGEKFLVVRLRVTNVGSGAVELTPALFRFESGGVVYEHRDLFEGGQGLAGVTLGPNDTDTGWMAFPIPAEATAGSIVVDAGATNGTVRVTFEHDPTMPVHMPD